jgi:hypothetical protein
MDPPLLCLTDPFLGPLKVLICGPSKDPRSGYLCIPKFRRNLSSGDAARVKLFIALRGRFLGPYRLGKGQKVENGGVTEPEQG